ncbi:MAG: hypothetical protein UY63_C0017G0005 [Parcubacteria group bacterium GW2011_GWA2_51_10]|nr:MAG: hypothetical protein UY63_C0017G0005 [Parcubacteria group bacterium GW2011_GWA2_51_10]
MKEDFLGTFLGNPARGKLLRVFVFEQTQAFTAAKAAKRAGVSLKAAHKELKGLEQIGIIKKKIEKAGRKSSKKKPEKVEAGWILNLDFKHVRALSAFVHEVSPGRYADIVGVLKNSGRLTAVIISGCFMGDPTRPADLIIVADNMNEGRLEAALGVLERLFGREIRYSAFSTLEFRYRLTIEDRLIRDTLDYPHQVLLDKARLL